MMDLISLFFRTIMGRKREEGDVQEEDELSFFQQPGGFIPSLVIIFGLGLVIGLCSAALSWLLTIFQTYLLGSVETLTHPTAFEVPYWRRVASVTIACTIAAVVWWWIRRRERIPSVAAGVAGDTMPVGGTVIHALLQIFIVGAGASVGRETAPREIGALVGQKLSAWWKLSRKDMALVTAVGAGAGFAGVYNAPLAGMFFAVEILLADVGGQTVVLALGTSLVSAFVGSSIHGTDRFYMVRGLNLSWQLLLFSCLAGPLAGLAAYLFRSLTSWATKRSERSVHILWALPVMGLATGLIAIDFPEILGNGRSLAQTAFNTTVVSSLPFLAFMMVMKTGATVMTIRSGASGGVLTPAVAVGACLGAICGFGWTAVFPTVSIGTCALVASAAFLATSQRAPLMATAFMLELTHASISFLLPVGLAVSLSVLTSRRMESWSLHEK